MAFYYYTLPGGGVAYRESSTVPVVPGDWVETTEGDYNTQLAIIQADVEADQEAAKLAACLVRKAVYDDLKASSHTNDWSEETFRFLSGYKPGDC